MAVADQDLLYFDTNSSMRKFLVPVAAGVFTGMSVELAFFPVDTIKTRLQASSVKTNFMKNAS